MKSVWQVSSEYGKDYLEFYIDGDRQDRISGTPVDWQKKSYTVSGAGSHTLKWRFFEDGSGGSSTDCGRVDFLRWTGSTINPPPDLTNWETINYKYDPSGRRIKKKVDNYTIRYLYDGGNVIGEYDINGNLLRKYIYGPCVDEPVCMIDVADSNAVYYYHYDALGSVMALSDSNGDSCQSYEYSVYGQVAAEGPNHTNPYMFTGRRFDIETGLYYYRARYYNPYIGRFLQTDPVGYGDGINWYAYCKNNPLKYVDPSGMLTSSVTHPAALPVIVAEEGFQFAIDTWGTAMVIQYIFDTQGQDIVVGGQTMELLPEYDPCDPNTWEYGPQTKSFDDIMDDPNLWKRWNKKRTYNWDRPYNVYESLRIIQNYEKYYGVPPTVHDKHPDRGGGDDDEGKQGPHMHPPHRRKKHVWITEKAYDFLKNVLGL